MKLINSVTQAVKDTRTNIQLEVLLAFIQVESGGYGFDKKTGKLLIQFEPAWFKKKTTFAPSGLWQVNKVDVQSKEWSAFNNAFSINANAAMEATSIGLPQILGLHWQRLRYASVGEMWDDFKQSETNQIKSLIRYIETDTQLFNAILQHDWHRIATIYNGNNYMGIAAKYGRTPYNIAMQDAYNHLVNL